MSLLGVCYYPEHWPESRWAQDATQMRALGLDVVRLGEFAWAKMEPAEAQFDWGWLDRAIETLAGAGLKLILGTPTPTPPAWLTHSHPDILPVDIEGRRRRHGGRHHTCPNAPAYHVASERIVRALAERYGQHPALVGWQIDNEFGEANSSRCYCDHCAAAFQRWLAAHYGDLDGLNAAWGTIFWSQTYTDWAHIQPPNLTLQHPNPSHALDYYRFASDSWVKYQRAQIDILRPLSPDRWITHNFMGAHRELDYHALAADLDFVSWDSYPTGYAEHESALMYGPGASPAPHAYDVGDPALTGFYHSLMVGLKNRPTWVMEQQPGHVNWGRYNPTPRPGVVRYWTLEDMAHGVDTIVYFRWRAVHLAQEQFHSGLLKHDGSPDQGVSEVARVERDRDLLTRLQGTRTQADVALLYAYPDEWAADLQPHNIDFDLRTHLFTYYRAFHRAGHPVAIVHPMSDLSRFPLVVAPTLWLVDDALVAHLRAYVEQGGTLMIGPRSGFKTASNLVHPLGPPGALTPLTGARITGFHSLPPGVTYGLRWPEQGDEADVLVWAEGLAVERGVEAVASWGRGLLEGQAAVTLRGLANGQVAYCGAWPSDSVADGLVSWLAHIAGVWEVAEVPAGVLATRRSGADHEYLFLVNGTDEYQIAALYPPAWSDARSGEAWPATVTIPPRDVLIGTRPVDES